MSELSQQQLQAISKCHYLIQAYEHKIDLIKALSADFEYHSIEATSIYMLDVRLSLPEKLASVMYALSQFPPVYLDGFGGAAKPNNYTYRVEAKDYGKTQVYFVWVTRLEGTLIRMSCRPISLSQAHLNAIDAKYKLAPSRGAKFGLYNWQNLEKGEPITEVTK
jgi:hypothetical protein